MRDQDVDNISVEMVGQSVDLLQSCTCHVCGRGDVIGHDCIIFSTPCPPARTVQPDSVEDDVSLEAISAETSTAQGAPKVPFAPNDAGVMSNTFNAGTISSMEIPVAADGTTAQCPSTKLMESAVSSMTGSIFEETPHQGSPCSELRGVNHFPLSESTSSVGPLAKKVPTQPQDQLQQPQANCLPGQEPDGSGIVAGSESVVWRCDQCRIVSSRLDPDCPICHFKHQKDFSFPSAFRVFPAVDDPAKAHMALRFIASEYPLSRSASMYECSALVEALRLHGPHLRTMADVGLNALKIVSFNNLAFIVPSGGFDVLYTLMREHATSEKAALHGCSMTERSCFVSAVYQNTIRLAGGVDAIITVLRIHANHAEISRAACSALHKLVINNDENKSTVAVSGGVAAVLCAITASGHDVGVARNGCAALLDVLLTLSELELNRTFADVGILTVIIATMRCHPSIAEISTCGCSILLWILQCDITGYTGAEIAASIDVVLASMTACHFDAIAATKGCAVLCLLSERYPMAMIQTGAEGILLAFACLKNHSGSLTLVEWALGGIYNLTGNGHELEVVLPEASISIIAAAVLEHTTSSPVVAMHGCALLRNLIILPKFYSQIFQHSVIDALCATARFHSGDVKVVEHVSCSLRFLSQHIDGRGLLFQSGGIELVCSNMRAHLCEAVIVEHSCGALAELSIDGFGVSEAPLSATEIIISAMAIHRENPETVLQICNALSSLCCVANCASYMDIHLIISTLSTHSKIITIVRTAAALCGKLLENKGRLAGISKGSVKAIVCALKRHANDTVVLRNGCCALFALAHSDRNHATISDSNGVEFALAALRACPDDQMVIEQACGTLWLLTDVYCSRKFVASIALQEKNCTAIVKGNGVQLLFSCLRTVLKDDHGGSTVIKHLCDTLISIAELPDHRLAEAGAVDATLELLEFQQNNKSVFCLACFLVERMAITDDNHDILWAMCNGGAINHILSMMERHEDHSSPVAKSACSALSCLIANDDINLKVMMDSAGGFDRILSALSTVSPLRRNGFFGAKRPADDDDVQIDCVLLLMKTHCDRAIVATHGCVALLNVLKRSDFSARMKTKGQQPVKLISHFAKAIWLALQHHHHVEDCFVAGCEALAAIASFGRKYCDIVEQERQIVCESDDVLSESIFLAVKVHGPSPRAVEPAWALLRHILLHHNLEDDSLLCEHCHVAEHAIEMLNIYFSHGRIVEHCCAVLNYLTAHASKQKLSQITEGAFPSILVVLHNHCSDVSVAGWGCGALYHLAKHGHYLEILGDEDNLQVMLNVLLANKDVKLVCNQVWSIIYHFVRKDSVSSSFITNRNIKQLLTVASKGNERIADNACGALRNISPDRLVDIVGTEIPWVVGQLLTLMQSHATCAGVVERACGAMHNLISAASSVSTDVVLPEGIVTQVLSALCAHSADSGVAVQTCGVLRYLSVNIDHAAVLVKTGGISIVLASLGDHVRHDAVGVNACETLRNLVLAGIEGATTSILAPGDAIQLLLSFLCYCTSLPPVKSGCLLLQELISGNPDAQAIVVNNGGIEVLVKIVNAFLGSNNVSDEVLEVVCNLLWMTVADNTEYQRLLRRVDSSRYILKQVLRQSKNEDITTKVNSILNAMESLPLRIFEVVQQAIGQAV